MPSARLPEKTARAVEFFSGIGAFAQAAADAGITVVAAFDQSESANRTYRQNYGLNPSSRNLDIVSAADIPASDLWWLSPPCTPYSVRGRRRDEEDPRARSFLNLIEQIPRCLPAAILLENVQGFVGSRAHRRFLAQLEGSYYRVREFDLCPTDFGVPMRRLRHFVAAVRGGTPWRESPYPSRKAVKLAEFLEENPDQDLFLDESTLTRYGKGFDIVDPDSAGAYLSCFTSGYWRCRKASGSLLGVSGGAVRRVSPEEILRLLDFSGDFKFPEDLPRPMRWRLVGNSVDVRAVRFLLSLVGDYLKSGDYQECG